MREIEFIEDTWIRSELSKHKEVIIGYMKAGKVIKVRNKMITSSFEITDPVRGQIITSDQWFTDDNGWYYWYGGTVSGFSKLVKPELSLLPETQLAIQDKIDFTQLPNLKMCNAVETYSIHKYFWNQGCYGQGVKVAILDTGFEPRFNPLPKNRLVNFSEKKDKNTFYNKSNHGGKALALLKYFSETYLGLIPKADIYFFKVVEENDSYLDIMVKINEAINRCKEIGIPVINISLAINLGRKKRKLTRKERWKELEKLEYHEKKLETTIREYQSVGRIICAVGNKKASLKNAENNQRKALIPARFKDTICIGSYGLNNDNEKIINNSLNNDNVQFLIEGDNSLVPFQNEFSDSSAATVVFSGLVGLLLSKLKKSGYTTTKLFQLLDEYQPQDKYFDMTEFLEKHIT